MHNQTTSGAAHLYQPDPLHLRATYLAAHVVLPPKYAWMYSCFLLVRT